MCESSITKEMNQPLLHVMIPAYGKSPYLRQTLESAVKHLPLEVPITVIEDPSEEADLEKNFKLMKTQFVDKGIPVLLGEFGAIRRTTLTGDALTLHLNSRAYYLKTVVKTAKANGLLPFYWDEGSLGNNGFGIINRTNNTVFDIQALTALKEGLL